MTDRTGKGLVSQIHEITTSYLDQNQFLMQSWVVVLNQLPNDKYHQVWAKQQITHTLELTSASDSGSGSHSSTVIKISQLDLSEHVQQLETLS